MLCHGLNELFLSCLVSFTVKSAVMWLLMKDFIKFFLNGFVLSAANVNDKPIAFVFVMHSLLSSDDKMVRLSVAMARRNIFRPVLRNLQLDLSLYFIFPLK